MKDCWQEMVPWILNLGLVWADLAEEPGLAGGYLGQAGFAKSHAGLRASRDCWVVCGGHEISIQPGHHHLNSHHFHLKQEKWQYKKWNLTFSKFKSLKGHNPGAETWSEVENQLYILSSSALRNLNFEGQGRVLDLNQVFSLVYYGIGPNHKRPTYLNFQNCWI